MSQAPTNRNYIDPRPSSEDTAISYEGRRNAWNGPSAESILLQGCEITNTIRPLAAIRQGEIQLVGCCRINLLAKQDKICKMVEAGRMGRASNLRRQLFHSNAARVIAANIELKIFKREHPGCPRPTLLELVNLMKRGESHFAYAEPKAKADGRYRYTHTYSLVDRAYQRLLVLSFAAGITFLPNQAGVPGQSNHQVAGLIEAAIRSGKYKFACQVDIRGFFSNVDPDKIGETSGMKSDIVARYLTNREKERSGKRLPRNARAYRDWNNIVSHSERGLPEGSCASPIFAYSTLVPVLNAFRRRFESRVLVFNYCDNFLILAPTKGTVVAAISSLSELLRQSADDLMLRYPPIGGWNRLFWVPIYSPKHKTRHQYSPKQRGGVS